MKIRNGFVSNSSAASFVIAIGRVKDPTQFISYSIDHQLHGINLFHLNEETLKYMADLPYSLTYKTINGNEYICIESFNSMDVWIPKSELHVGDMLAYMDIDGCHNDDDFTDEYGNYDFNVDGLSFGEYEDSIELFQNEKKDNNMLDHVDISIGAGYNG